MYSILIKLLQQKVYIFMQLKGFNTVMYPYYFRQFKAENPSKTEIIFLKQVAKG